MSIDYSSITDELIGIAVDAIGSELSTQSTQVGTRPSVIKARGGNKTNKPNTPYVVIDLLDTQTVGGGLTDLIFDPLDESLHYIVDKNVFFRFSCYSDDQWNSNTIIDDLHSVFNLEGVKARLRSVNCSVKDTRIVLSLPEPLATDFQGVAVFDLTVSTKDRVSDTTSGVFETIEVGNNLYRYEGDPAPLPVDFDVGTETLSITEATNNHTLVSPPVGFVGWGHVDLDSFPNTGMGLSLPVTVGDTIFYGVYTEVTSDTLVIMLRGNHTEFPINVSWVDDLKTFDSTVCTPANGWVLTYNTGHDASIWTKTGIATKYTNATVYNILITTKLLLA